MGTYAKYNQKLMFTTHRRHGAVHDNVEALGLRDLGVLDKALVAGLEVVGPVKHL